MSDAVTIFVDADACPVKEEVYRVAERYAATAMTLEMPFKDNADHPDEVQGWSPERSRMLARDCLGALLEFLESED